MKKGFSNTETLDLLIYLPTKKKSKNDVGYAAREGSAYISRDGWRVLSLIINLERGQ